MSLCHYCFGIAVTTLAGVGNNTILGTGSRLCFLINIAMSMRSRGSRNKSNIEEVYRIILGNRVRACTKADFKNLIRRNIVRSLVYLNALACGICRATEHKHKHTVNICGEGNVGRRLDFQTGSKIFTIKGCATLRCRCTTGDTEEAFGINLFIGSKAVNLRISGNNCTTCNTTCVTAVSCVVATACVVTAACVVTTGATVSTIVATCGRCGNGIGSGIGINRCDSNTGNSRFLILTATYIIEIGLNEIIAGGKIACCATTNKEIFTILVTKNYISRAATMLTESNIYLGINIEHDVRTGCATANTNIIGAELGEVIHNVIICTGGRNGCLSKCLGIIKNNRRCGVSVCRNNRYIHILGRKDIILLCTCICQNNSLHISDALLDYIITRGNVANRSIGIKVLILISGGNLGCSIGYNSSTIVTCEACNRVIIALYRTRSNVNRVLTVIEPVVLGEDICICSGVHTIGCLTLKDVVIHMDIRLTCERTTGLTVLPVVVMICDMILERIIRRTNEVGLVVTLIVAVGVGEVLTALKVTGTVTAVLITLSRIGNHRSDE